MLYRYLLKPALFALDAERAHDVALSAGSVISRSATALSVIRTVSSLGGVDDPVEVAGLRFRNRVGVAAGLDKDARIVPLLDALGFGHCEIGTVTYRPQSGNPKPRVVRFPEDKAIINAMGFPSEGARVLADRLAILHERRLSLVLGVNIGKSKDAGLDEAADDYCQTMALLHRYGSYFTINVSSPNTPDLRRLQEPARLSALFRAVQGENKGAKPLFLKLSPDLDSAQLAEIVSVCVESGIGGIIATNTTLGRGGLSAVTDAKGGLSGRPLFPRSCEVVSELRRLAPQSMPIIGVGGIFSPLDAVQMCHHGASLVQIYTGLVYEGPRLLQRIVRELRRAEPRAKSGEAPRPVDSHHVEAR